MRDDRRRSGRTVTSLLVLLVLLLGAGGANYVRNMQAEQADATPRPFESYATGDLEALRSAYAAEVEAFQKRYDAQAARRQRASGSGLMDQRVREFEQIQQTSTKLRELRADVAEREARLRELDAEIAARAGRVQGLALHLERLLTI